MTVKQFQELQEVDQLKILIQSGILIGEITEKTARTFLYQIHDFYVETRYTLETDDLITIEPFSEIEREDRTRWMMLDSIKRDKEKYTD